MEENFLDRAIAFVSPSWAASRARSRVFYNSIRSYDAASKGRRGEDWFASGSSANTETRNNLITLRDRSREQDRNNPYVRKAINVFRNNIAGNGIRLSLQATVKDRENILLAWNNWADDRYACDFDEHLHLYAMQALAVRTMVMSGEVLIVRKRVKFQSKDSVPLQIQILEPDFLDNTKDIEVVTKTGGKIMQGIEYYANGKRKGYWLYSVHPGEINTINNLVSTFVPAKDVIHLYEKDRPGQERGVPAGTPSMTQLRDLKDYQDFQLIKQKAAACFTAFVNSDNPNQEDYVSSDGELTEKLEPGLIQHLRPGEQVTFASPPSTEGYSEHTKKLLQGAATGFGVTYESLTGDLSQVNYSSFRGGWLEFQRLIQHMQYNVITPIMCDTIFQWWMEAAAIAGIVPSEVKIKPSWTAPRREMIDPSKEIGAMKEAIKGGLTSLSEVARENGWDPDELFKEIKSDMDRLEKEGIIIDTDPRNDMPPAAPQNGSENDPKTGGKKGSKTAQKSKLSTGKK